MRRTKRLEKGEPGHLEDRRGKNIAFDCAACVRVQIVGGVWDKTGRLGENCGKPGGFDDEHGVIASVEWDVESSLFEKRNEAGKL